MLYITSIFPNVQISNLLRLKYIASLTNRDINFSNLNEEFALCKPSILFLVSVISLVIEVLIFVWVWPTRIDPDPENPKTCCHPFTWCCKRPVEIEDADEETSA
jgi:hypothetical protein